MDGVQLVFVRSTRFVTVSPDKAVALGHYNTVSQRYRWPGRCQTRSCRKQSAPYGMPADKQQISPTIFTSYVKEDCSGV
jgi:hypothetical protein